MAKAFEIKFENFPYRNHVAAYELGGKVFPPVCKDENGKYHIRIKTGMSVRGRYVSYSYDYFVLDETGLIIQSPRGLAREYNKKVRIIDIAQITAQYKQSEEAETT